MLASVVVFDTSVLIPLIIPASRSTRLFSRLERAGWQVAVSPQILEHDFEGVRIMNRQQFESELNRLGVPSAANEE